ncbi:PEGA domain-containing protein [Myxococcota bacterium]
MWIRYGAAAAIALVAILLAFWPSGGSLLITVSGPNGMAVDMLEVRVDEKLVCDKSPCRVAGLADGSHTVNVRAPGYVKSATRGVVVVAGETAAEAFLLVRASTGVRIGALAPKSRLVIDGQDRGPLPANIDDLRSGSHTIRIEGNPGYKPHEELITLAAGEMKTLEPKLTPAIGLARFEAGANARGARVVLACGEKPKVVLKIPSERKVPLGQDCQVEASKSGFESSTTELVFDGKDEKTFTIELAKMEEAAEEEPATQGRETRARPARQTRKPAGSAGGKGSIAINSIPVSNATVDGRPVGQTPANITVGAGPHVVVFTHPTKGRRSVVVNVKAGRNAVAAVRF